MRPIQIPFLVPVLALALAGCAGQPIRTAIGRVPPDCRTLGEVTGLRGDVGRREHTGEPQLLDVAARLGANVLRYRSAIDEVYRATAHACADGSRFRRAWPPRPARLVRSEPSGACEELGAVESSDAASQVELREILARSAGVVGGNVLRIDYSGPRAVPTYSGPAVERFGGVGTVYFCPDG
jgi:hypothetical protein